jgi:hypothetical protein
MSDRPRRAVAPSDVLLSSKKSIFTDQSLNAEAEVVRDTEDRSEDAFGAWEAEERSLVIRL